MWASVSQAAACAAASWGHAALVQRLLAVAQRDAPYDRATAGRSSRCYRVLLAAASGCGLAGLQALVRQAGLPLAGALGGQLLINAALGVGPDWEAKVS
jgi:hypothetical protein